MTRTLATISSKSIVTVVPAIVLAGCLGGGGGGGGGNSGGGGGGGSDIIDQPSGDVSGAQELYYFTTGNQMANTKSLIAMDPDAPGNQVVVEPDVVNNHSASNETAFPSAPGRHIPNARTLPLGVFSANVGPDGMNGDITDVSHPYVVYNTPDGYLYRANTVGDDPDPQRISSESGADIVCGAAITPDFTDPADAVLVYQIAGGSEANRTCASSTWRMVRVGDDAQTAPVDVFPGEEIQQGGSIIPIQDWDTGAAAGFLAYVELVGAGSGLIQRVYADGTSDSVVLGTTGTLHVLERIGPDGIMLFNHSGSLTSYDPAGPQELNAVTGDSTVTNETGGEDAVRVAGRIMIADGGQGRLLEYDPATNAATEIHDQANWENAITRIVGATDDYVAWVYTYDELEGDPLDQNYRAELRSYNIAAGTSMHLMTLDNGGSTIFPSVQLNRRFPVFADEAANGWLFINDFDNQKAVALNMVSQTQHEIDQAEWWGYTWSRTIGTIGRVAERVLALDYDVAGGQLQSLDFRARDADDPTTLTQVSFAPPAELERVDFTGYGSRTLSGMIRSDAGTDMLFFDLETDGGLIQVSDTQESLSRPVPDF